MKRFFTILFLLPLIAFSQDKVINGKVLFEREAFPGSTILLSGTQNGTSADVDGNFSLSVPATKKLFDLEISAIGFATIRIKDISVSKSVNLGKIELVFNKFLSDEESKKLGYDDLNKLERTFCYGTALGYQDRSKITKDIIPCPLNPMKVMVINYDSVINEVIIPYSQIISCQ